MDKMISQLRQKQKAALPLSDAELQFMLDHIGHRDAQVRDELIYGLFCHALDHQLFTIEQVKHIRNHIMEKNLPADSSQQCGISSVLTRSFSVLVLALLLYADDSEKSIYYRFLTEPERKEMMDLGIGHMASENDASGYLPEFGWVHSIAHAAELLLSIVRHSLCDSDWTEKIGKAIFKAFTKQKAVFCDKEEKRIGLVLVAMLRKKSLRIHTLNAWILSYERYFSKQTSEVAENLRAKENVINMLNFILLFLETAEAEELLESVRKFNQIMDYEAYLG